MSELIDRQQAIDAIAQCTNCGDEDTLREYVLKHNLDNGWTGGILEALDAVKDLPTAQSEKAQLSHEGTTSDLISRTETVERLRGVLDVTVPITDYDEGYVDGVEVGISTVSTMPPAQPEPKEGQWKKDETDDCPPVFRQFRICSVCGAIETSETNYCPNCGARMTNK